MKLFNKSFKSPKKGKYHLPTISSLIALTAGTIAMTRAIKQTKHDVTDAKESAE